MLLLLRVELKEEFVWQLKYSLNNKFPYSYRLHHPHEFILTIKSSKQTAKWFTLYYSENKNNYPRIGVVVSKRTTPSAVARNKIKRVARECFRKLAFCLAPVDFVVRINKTLMNEGDMDFFRGELSSRLKSFTQVKND